MGKKKKQFINKKEAHSYKLVPRSHQDPLAGDSSEAQHVLMPAQSQEPGGSGGGGSEAGSSVRLREQERFGIFFQDDYDYLQHLRVPGTAVLEPIAEDAGRSEGGTMERAQEMDGKDKVHLPSSVFGSEVQVEGRLDRVVPVRGPCPNWDPEVVEAMEQAEMAGGLPGGEEEDQLDLLEDDFVLLANGGEPGVPVYVANHQSEGGDSGSGSVWWKDRVDFLVGDGGREGVSGGEGDDECSSAAGASGSSAATREDKGEGFMEGVEFTDDDLREKRTAQFTQYSMTSSVLPRSEALTLLDDRFEQFMVQYNDDQLGAGDEEQEEVGLVGAAKKEDERRAEYDQMLLQSAVDDFTRNFSISASRKDFEDEREEVGEAEAVGMAKEESDHPEVRGDGGMEGNGNRKLAEEEGADQRGSGSSAEEEVGTSEDEENHLEPFDRVEVSSRSKWDCESILSTYSTLYNHPTKIVEPPRAGGKVKLSRKTGIPLGVIPGPLPKESVDKTAPVSRPKNEDKDDKRLRKSKVKEERKQRRVEKKATKLAFKSESLKQEKCFINSAVMAAPLL